MDKLNTHNTIETKERQVEHDRFIAISILRSLVDSTIKDELQYYWTPVQDHLNLSDEDMRRIFDLETIVNLLTPTETYKRYFHGKRVENWVNSPSDEEKPKLLRTTNISIVPKKNGRKRQRLFNKTPSAIIDKPVLEEETLGEKTLEEKPLEKYPVEYVNDSLVELTDNTTVSPKSLFSNKESEMKIENKEILKFVNNVFEGPTTDFTSPVGSVAPSGYTGPFETKEETKEKTEKVEEKNNKQFEELLNSNDSVKEESIEEKSDNESENETTENDKEEDETAKRAKKKDELVVKKLKALLVKNGCDEDELEEDCTFETDNPKCPNSVLFKGKKQNLNVPKKLGKYNAKHKAWIFAKKKINKQYKEYLSKQKIEIAEKEE